jgi:hypothetical protein
VATQVSEAVSVDVNSVIDILGFLDHCRDVVAALNDGKDSPFGNSFRREGDRFFRACFDHNRDDAFCTWDDPAEAAMTEAGIQTAAEAMTTVWLAGFVSQQGKPKARLSEGGYV